MNLARVLGGSVAALAAWTLTADGAFASNLNLSKSDCCRYPNRYASINTGDPKAAQACKDAGGRVGKDPNGQPACITSDPKVVQACSDNGGKLERNANGEDVCVGDARTAAPGN